jgi:YD repeat-containing protein
MKITKFFQQAIALYFAILAATFAHADGLNEPIPSYYQEAGISRNRGYENQHANEVIDPFTGKLQWHFTDLFIPGNGGLDIAVQRSYSSLNEQLNERSPFGVGWTMHFGRVIRRALVSLCDRGQPATRNAVMELPDGSRQMLYPALDNATFISAGFWKASCRNDINGGLDITSPDGTRYEMSTRGLIIGDISNEQSTTYTTRIIDRNGNTLNFTYVTLGLANGYGVKTITASDGRVVTFNYAANGSLASVTDGTRTWTYLLSEVPSYGNVFNLDEVRRPDGNSWKYQYNAAGSIPGSGTPGGFSMKKVTYPTGGTFDYVYQFVDMAPYSFLPKSTVIKTKQGDNALWTFKYKPATKPVVITGDGKFYFEVSQDAPQLEYDTTTVVGPEGTAFYMHMGYNSAKLTSPHLIGSILLKINGYLDSDPSKAVYGKFNAMHTESNEWSPLLISTQFDLRPGASSGSLGIFIPLLSQRTVWQYGQKFTTSMSNFDTYANPQTISETGTDSRTTTLTYNTDSAKWIIRQKKTETVSTIPGSISRTFDSNGNVLTETRYGTTTTFTYDAMGNVASKRDARGNSITYGSYHRGIPRSEAQPEGVTISRTVNDQGNVTSQTDGAAATTTYSYDGLNRLLSIGHPTGNAVTVTWGANSRKVTRGGYTETITFDNFGREIKTDHSGEGTVTQTFAYDSMGKRKFASYPNSSLGTCYKYDMLGKPLIISHDCTVGGATYVSVRSMTYDGATVKIRNERGFNFIYTYRSYGDPGQQELMSVSTPDPSVSTVMSRNGLGQLTQVTQNSKTRTFSYNSAYYLTSMTDPEVGTTIYGRDAVGNMTSRKVNSSGPTSFDYDNRNRLVLTNYPTNNPPLTPNVTNTYYPDDKLKSSEKGSVKRDYAYNGNKNLTQETLTITGQPPFNILYAYDGNDALDVMTYSSGKKVSYRPDAFGRATQAAPYITQISHHPTGQVASMRYANGVQTKVDLNARQWPIKLAIGSSTNIVSSNYSYDNHGNVLSIIDASDASYNRTLSYDKNDRLTGAIGSWGSGAIAYSGDGNIQSQQLGGMNLNYGYSGENRLTAISGSKTYAFSYDVYGNVSGNGVNTFAYNDASNMRCANCGQANEVTYNYDGSNMRVSSTKAGVSTYYVYGLNGSLLSELTPGVNRKDYIYLHGKQIAVHQKNLP